MTRSRGINFVRGCVIVIALGAGIVVWRLGSGHRISQLTYGDSTFNAGRISSSAPWIQHDFSIRNDNAVPFTIDGITPSCSCVTAQLDSASVGPGQTTILRVAMDLTGRIDAQQQSVVVSSTGGGKKFAHMFHMQATVVDSSATSPPAIVFRGPGGVHATQRVRLISLVDSRKFRVTGFKVSDPLIRVAEISGPANDVSAEKEFDISIVPGTISGLRREEVVQPPFLTPPGCIDFEHMDNSHNV